MKQGFFITGTDTEIGKTTITAALTHMVLQAGWRSAAVKPLAAGQELLEGRWVNDDVQRLHAAGVQDVTEEEVGPLQLRTACAPHIAAMQEGCRIERSHILRAIGHMAQRVDVLMVEGVGGFRVPLISGWDTADLAVDLGLPVVLVVGLRLGCINHALLTAEAVRSRGLTLAGWVANAVDPAMPFVTENLLALQEGLQAPCWGHVPRLPGASPSPADVAVHLTAARPFVLPTVTTP